MKKQFVIIGIAVILFTIALNGCLSFNEEQFDITIVNLLNERFEIECFIFKNSHNSMNFTVVFTDLKPNESHVFHLKYEKINVINRVSMRVTNYTYFLYPSLSNDSNHSILKYNGLSTYAFPNGTTYDLLAIISPATEEPNTTNISENQSGNISGHSYPLYLLSPPVKITIVPMPKSPITTTLKF